MAAATSEDKQIFLSADMACRLAAIDIGSNSVRLLVAEALRGGAYRILDEEREPTRLGRSVSEKGQLDDESMERTITALRTFKQIAAGYQATSLRTIATCAVREARNGPEFCRRVREQVGLEVEVISGDREARLAFSSVQNAFDLSGKNVIVADIGGGSTEVVFATGDLIESIFSTPLGPCGSPNSSPSAKGRWWRRFNATSRGWRRRSPCASRSGPPGRSSRRTFSSAAAARSPRLPN